MVPNRGSLMRALSAGRRARGQPRRVGFDHLEPRVTLSAFFVSPSGDDSAAGSASAPWRTLQHAANLVQPGDVVDVLAGSYSGFVMGWDYPQGGTAAAPITF